MYIYDIVEVWRDLCHFPGLSLRRNLVIALFLPCGFLQERMMTKLSYPFQVYVGVEVAISSVNV